MTSSSLRPRRAPAPALFVLSAVLLVFGPVLSAVALASLPTHGDGFGAIGEAVVAGSIAWACRPLALLLATMFTLVGRPPYPRDAAPDG